MIEFVISGLIGALVGSTTVFVLGQAPVTWRIEALERRVTSVINTQSGVSGVAKQREYKAQEEEAIAQAIAIFMDKNTQQDQKMEKLKELAVSNPSVLRLAKKYIGF